MRSIAVSALLTACSLCSLPAATTIKPDPTQEEIDRIIKTVADTESAFAKARENYTYRQTAKLQEYDEGGNPAGRFEIVTDIVFDDKGRRQERVVRAPTPTLRLIIMTPEDEQDLRQILPFVLTGDEAANYWVRYLGRANADEIPCYVFAIKPRKLESGKRYFTGQIWVDDRDLMVVKTYGRSIGAQKKGFDQQFPKFETYRQQIDGKYWFPVYTMANSTLYFADSHPSVKETVKYEDYKQFKAESKITVVDSTITPGEPAAPPKAAPKPEAPKK
jgi:hypothetical protein